MNSYQHEWGESKWKACSGPPPKLPPADHTAVAIQRVISYLEKRQLDPYLAEWNGWYPANMEVLRIVIPCVNSTNTVYYQARRMDDSDQLRYDSPMAPRGDSIVVVHPKKLDKSRAVIVEGAMDALAAAMHGFLGIAVMGNNPANEAIDLIVAKFAITHAPFIVVPDMDDPTFGAKMVASFSSRGVKSKAILLTGGKDICGLSNTDRRMFFGRINKGK